MITQQCYLSFPTLTAFHSPHHTFAHVFIHRGCVRGKTVSAFLAVLAGPLDLALLTAVHVKDTMAKDLLFLWLYNRTSSYNNFNPVTILTELIQMESVEKHLPYHLWGGIFSSGGALRWTIKSVVSLVESSPQHWQGTCAIGNNRLKT